MIAARPVPAIVTPSPEMIHSHGEEGVHGGCARPCGQGREDAQEERPTGVHGEEGRDRTEQHHPLDAEVDHARVLGYGLAEGGEE
jgi:hypothetical protein